jgi:hypothetical protein
LEEVSPITILKYRDPADGLFKPLLGAATTLEQCRRYFWRFFGDVAVQAASATLARAAIQFPVPMRAAPAITMTAAGSINLPTGNPVPSSISPLATRDQSVYLDAIVSGMTVGQPGTWNAFVLDFSAEL